jgi:hypothetical protein
LDVGRVTQTKRSGEERFDGRGLMQVIIRSSGLFFLKWLKNPLCYKRIHGLSALNLSMSRSAVPA